MSMHYILILETKLVGTGFKLKHFFNFYLRRKNSIFFVCIYNVLDFIFFLYIKGGGWQVVNKFVLWTI